MALVFFFVGRLRFREFEYYVFVIFFRVEFVGGCVLVFLGIRVVRL